MYYDDKSKGFHEINLGKMNMDELLTNSSMSHNTHHTTMRIKIKFTDYHQSKKINDNYNRAKIIK